MPGKTVDINFELKEIKLSKEKILENLYSKVEELLKENQLIKNEQEKIRNELKYKNNELENLKNEYKCIEEENIHIKNRLKNIEEYFSILKEVQNSNQYYDFDKSYIIKNKDEKYILKKWISINGKIKKINLLYRATEDGDNGKSFYTKCSCKGSTISLIKTKKGRRFGGFSKVEWKNIKTILEDNNAFLFSLDNMKKYNILKKNYAIGNDPYNFCLIYGNNLDGKGIYLVSNFLNNKSREEQSSRVYDVHSDYCLSGENDFYTEEVEVYQIIFE